MNQSLSSDTNTRLIYFFDLIYTNQSSTSFLFFNLVVALPSVKDLALVKLGGFAECQRSGTRQRHLVCRVPFRLALDKASVNSHFAGVFTLFCRWRFGTRQSFAECSKKGTRQSLLRRHNSCQVSHSANPLPSVIGALPSVWTELVSRSVIK